MRQRSVHIVFVLSTLLLGILTGCNPASLKVDAVPGETRPSTPQVTRLPKTATITPTPSSTPSATIPASTTATGTTTQTAKPTIPPPTLGIFTHKLLRSNVQPQTYLTDPCEYLQLYWAPGKAEPGTIVVPIMFHGVRQAGRPISEEDKVSITEEEFNAFVAYAQNLGFETITAQELSDFLYTNAYIPPRSMILIVDDRRPGTVENYFLPAAEANNWHVTLGWIIGDTKDDLWERMEHMNESGYLDIQSHGYLHRYIVDGMDEEIVHEEIYAPIPIIEEHFGQKPMAFIWPGGNFTNISVTTAREANYQLAFTAYSRGPLMFNWIPQGEIEQAVNDPLMTLPRFWSTDVTLPLDIGAQIGEAARIEAQANREKDEEYYQRYCNDSLKP